MIAYPHRNNSDFQLRYFMAGSCYTPDGAWALMYGQMIDVEAKIEHSRAQALRREAKIAAAEEVLANPNASKSAKLAAEADIIEANSGGVIPERNLQAAINELATIKQIMAEIEPHRKYAHLPLLEANETAQRDEWLGELMRRAENFLATQGTIPHDQLNAMRAHPDFEAALVPHIQGVMAKLGSPNGALSVLTNNRLLCLEASNV